MDDDGGCCGCLVLCALLIVGGFVWLMDKDKKDAEVAHKQFEARAAKVAPSQLSLSGLRLSLGYTSELTGRIANHSRDSISSVDLKLTIYDCARGVQNLSECTVVASPDAFEYEIIPPSESRDFNAYVSLPSALAFRGEMQWTYRLTQVVATSP